MKTVFDRLEELLRGNTYHDDLVHDGYLRKAVESLDKEFIQRKEFITLEGAKKRVMEAKDADEFLQISKDFADSIKLRPSKN